MRARASFLVAAGSMSLIWWHDRQREAEELLRRQQLGSAFSTKDRYYTDEKIDAVFVKARA